jgi:hypothetical protein
VGKLKTTKATKKIMTQKLMVRSDTLYIVPTIPETGLNIIIQKALQVMSSA